MTWRKSDWLIVLRGRQKPTTWKRPAGVELFEGNNSARRQSASRPGRSPVDGENNSRFENQGLAGLDDKPGRVRRPSISEAKVARVVGEATRPPKGRSAGSAQHGSSCRHIAQHGAAYLVEERAEAAYHQDLQALERSAIRGKILGCDHGCGGSGVFVEVSIVSSMLDVLISAPDLAEKNRQILRRQHAGQAESVATDAYSLGRYAAFAVIRRG